MRVSALSPESLTRIVPPVFPLPAVCAGCGERLAPNGACIACLIRAGLDEEGDPDPQSSRDRIFGDFEIERREDGSLWELGRGAMGVTYRAADKVLHRSVALKVIEAPAGSDAAVVRERFLREARAAAALRHPNIAAVFQFGASPESDRCYCAMELVEGETLEARVRREGPITADLALEIGTQVAQALVAAGERGLVHRDLKPGNIMLAHGGNGALEVKVIDFGLAKATNTAYEMELTQGSFVGTPAFASPEQFRGETVDARSDIYALGVTLWFALTCRLPAAGTSAEEIRERQAQNRLPLEQLEAKGVPRPLVRVLHECLAIEAADRPASARELLQLLETCRGRIARNRRNRTLAVGCAVLAVVAGVSAFVYRGTDRQPWRDLAANLSRPIERGIAVLPFENLSAQAEDAFLADAIQDDVLTSIGKVKDLKVIARSSVQGYRGIRRSGKVRELGESLGISHVLEGSVRRTGERLVLNVALIDTRDERQVWAERYDRSVNEAASLHGELAREIGRALQATLTPLEKAAANLKPTENPDAYLLYLKGREMEVRGDLGKAVELYEQAVGRDPQFALARARFSKALTGLSYEQRRTDQQERARSEAEEALRLQPDLGEARVALAHWHLYLARDLDRASEELQRAGELLPNSAEVQLSTAFLFKRQNRFRERIAALQRAEALDPRNPAVLAFLIHTWRWVRNWPEAIHAADRRAVFTKGPAFLVSPWNRANDEFRLTGDINVLKRALNQEEQAEPPTPAERLHYARFEIASFERDFARAGRALDEVPAEAFHDRSGQQRPLFLTAAHSKELHQALLAIASGADAVEVGQLLARARIVAAAASNAAPLDAHFHIDLALVNAFEGRKDEAIQNVQHALGLTDEHTSRVEYKDLQSALALVYARTGEPAKALDLIEHLLAAPAVLQYGAIHNMTLTDLKWRWVWDPLREHARFQKLLAAPEPNTVY